MRSLEGPTDLDDPADYEKLGDEERGRATEWVMNRLEQARRPSSQDSYGLKHVMERETGLYVTNGQMKGVLIACGFRPVPKDQGEFINWRFYCRWKK